jgi:hypothetical protein
MMNRFCRLGGRNPAAIREERVADASNPAEPQQFSRLPGDEIERLIALCEAPALLWRNEPQPVREPEPFGMIA